jgi:gliding motility-associated-like protein
MKKILLSIFIFGTLLSANADTLDLYNNFIFSANNNATQRWTIWKKNNTGVYAPLFNDNYHRTAVVVSQDKTEMIYVRYRHLNSAQPPMWSSILDSAWICRNNIDGTNESILLLVPNFKRDAIYDMDWSSNKTQILFTLGNDRYPNVLTRDGDVFLYNITNSTLTNHTNNWDLWEKTAKFLKDNNYIYYSQCPNPWYGLPVDIYKKPIATGSPSKITSASGYSVGDQEVSITGTMNDGSVIYRRYGNYRLYKKKDSNAEVLLLNKPGCGGIEIGSDLFAATNFDDSIVLFKQSSVLKTFKISQISRFTGNPSYNYNNGNIIHLQWLGKLCAKTQSIVSIGADIQQYCGIDSIKLTATTGFKSYLWNNKDTGRSLYVKQTKKVTVIGTDAIGCKVYDTAIVSILNPLISPLDTVACYGSQIELRSNKIIPSQFYPTKLTWSTSDTTATKKLTVNSDTLVWLKATDGIGTCYDTTKVFVSKPYIALPDTTLFTTCQRDSMMVTIGSKWKSVLWSNGDMDSSTYLKTTGQYYVEAFDSYGCRDFDSIYFVNPGKLQITSIVSDSVNCFGLKDGSLKSQISGGFTPYKLSWNDPAKQTTDTAVNLAAGVYKLIIKDAYNCSDSATAVVYEPAALKASITSTDSVNCYGGSDGTILASVAGGTLGYTYQWDDLNRQTNLKASNLKKGLYKMVVKDYHGCSDSITASVHEPEKLVLSIPTIKQVSCYGYADGSATALARGGTGTWNYSWNTSPKQFGTSAVSLTPGSYKAFVTDVYGCSDSSIVVITEPEKIVPVITASRLAIRDVLHPLSCTVTPTQIYTYNWTPSGVFGTPSNYAVINGKFQTTTLVTLRTTDVNGCYGEDTATITVLIPFTDLIPTAFTPNGDGHNDVFGLPDYFEIEQLDIYNRWGEMLFKGSKDNPGWDGKFMGSVVPEGSYMYIIKAKLKGTSYTLEHQGIITVLK